RAHRMLVAGQIALTLLLLTSAGAAMNGFVHMINSDLGYDPRNTMSVGIPVHQNVHVSWEDRSAYFSQLLSRVQAIPGVSAAISSNATPPSNGSRMALEVFGQTMAQRQEVRLNMVSPEYFGVLRIPLVQGRLWEQAEVARAAGLAVINQTMAKQYWPNGDAIGRQIRLPEMKSDPPFMQAPKDASSWMQIIGVVADARDDGLLQPVKPAVYVPYTREMW